MPQEFLVTITLDGQLPAALSLVNSNTVKVAVGDLKKLFTNVYFTEVSGKYTADGADIVITVKRRWR